MVKEIESVKQFVKIINSDKYMFVVVDFFADWCGPCKKIAPFMDKLAEKYPDVGFRKINVDREELEKVSNACQVSSLPTFCFYYAGKYLTSIIGANEQNLEDTILKLLNSKKDSDK